MISQKYSKLIAANKNGNGAKFKFKGQSTRSQRWFDLEFEWIEVKFITHEPDIYKNLFQSHDDTKITNTFKSFQFPIGNSNV